MALAFSHLIKTFEGFSATPYPCPGGYQTIGYGHVLQKGEHMVFPLTHAQATYLLTKDLQGVSSTLRRTLKNPLLPHQFLALISFTFNVGARAFFRSTLRQKLNREDYTATREEFNRWVWAKGKKCLGLIKRRQVEADLFDGILCVHDDAGLLPTFSYTNGEA
jgi:lysozyme